MRDKKQIVEITQKAVRKNENKEGAFADLLNQEIEELKKARQIEEMAKIMANCDITCNECFEQFESAMAMKIKEREEHCQAYMFAKRAIESGYRKIPDGAVVLTEGQMDMLVSRPYHEDQVKKVRNETAKEILELLKSKLFDLGNVVTEIDLEDILKEYLR